VLVVDEARDVLHRARSIECDHGGQLAHVLGLELDDVAAHSAALELEDADRVALAEHIVSLFVVRRDRFDVGQHIRAVVRLDVL
jgi:hypothetical protein